MTLDDALFIRAIFLGIFLGALAIAALTACSLGAAIVLTGCRRLWRGRTARLARLNDSQTS